MFSYDYSLSFLALYILLCPFLCFNLSNCLDYARAKQIQLCSQDMCLPDAISLYGRLLLLALDMELDNVADDVPHLVALAVEVGRLGHTVCKPSVIVSLL